MRVSGPRPRSHNTCALAPSSTGVSPSAFTGDACSDPARLSSDAGARPRRPHVPPLPQPLRLFRHLHKDSNSTAIQVATERTGTTRTCQVQPDSLRHSTTPSPLKSSHHLRRMGAASPAERPSRPPPQCCQTAVTNPHTVRTLKGKAMARPSQAPQS